MLKVLKWSVLCIFTISLMSCNSANSSEESNVNATTEEHDSSAGIGEMTKTKGTIELNTIKTTGNFEVAVLGASTGYLKVSDAYLHLFNLDEEVNYLRLNLRIEHTSDEYEYLDFDKGILEIGSEKFIVDPVLTSYYANKSIYNVFSGDEGRDIELYFISNTFASNKKDYFANVESAKLYINAPYKVDNGIENVGSGLLFDISLQ